MCIINRWSQERSYTQFARPASADLAFTPGFLRAMKGFSRVRGYANQGDWRKLALQVFGGAGAVA
jgi:hypothetical protein